VISEKGKYGRCGTNYVEGMCSLTKLETSSPNNVFENFQRALFHKERK
jgi:hypothetical protein